MIKNSSKLAISAFLLASSYPESVDCKEESIQNTNLDSQINLQLDAEEQAAKHKKKHSSHKQEEINAELKK